MMNELKMTILNGVRHRLQSKYIKSIETGVLLLNNKPHKVTLDYHMDVSGLTDKFDKQTDTEFTKKVISIEFS